jgi:hypothetical protein
LIWSCRCGIIGTTNRNFDEQVSAAEQIYGPQVRFSFTRRDLLAALDGLEEYYPAETIERAERILREQMRKYPVYFRCGELAFCKSG